MTLEILLVSMPEEQDIRVDAQGNLTQPLNRDNILHIRGSN